MQTIPADIWEQYAAVLKKRAVPVPHYADYKKWLWYYLDFRDKYPLSDSKSEQVRLFIIEGGEAKQRSGSRFNDWRCLKKSASLEWDKIIDDLASEIKTRHYSRKTLKTYADWSRKFQIYLQNKPPEELSSTDVKSYLSPQFCNQSFAGKL